MSMFKVDLKSGDIFIQGNVGIGTTAPTSAFEVNGIIKGTVYKNSWMPRVSKLFSMSGGTASYLDVGVTNTSAKGFQGGFSDGRYAYLIPRYNGAYHGILTRVDINNYTTAGVTYLDVSTGGQVSAKGFSGGFTDGRYAYLVPINNGIVARVDLNSFNTAGISYINVSAAGNANANGFMGGFTDGRYAYLVPYMNILLEWHGIVTRIDLRNFTTSGVSYLDVSIGHAGAIGFQGGFTDGSYAYLVPNYTNSPINAGGIFTRIDLSNFTASGISYVNVTTGNALARYFAGGFTDGSYAYLVPSNNAAGYVCTRVDLNNFTTSGVSYVSTNIGNSLSAGFCGGFTDGQYAYLAPWNNGSGNYGILTRIDLSNFTTSGVSYLDVSTVGNTGAKGFFGAFSDGRYAYLVPYYNGVYHGILTRVLIADVFPQGY